MSDEQVKLPGGSYEEICRVVKTYGYLNEPASLEQVAKRGAMAKTVISRNHRFLVDVSILEGSTKKALTVLGRQLSLALSHGVESGITRTWSDVVSGNPFLNSMLQAVRVRNGMEASQLTSHIALSAGVPRGSASSSGARAVIDILRAAGLVTEDGDRVVPTQVSSPQRTPLAEAPPASEGREVREALPSYAQLVGVTDKQVIVLIQVQVQVSPSDLESLAPVLRKFKSDLEEAPPPQQGRSRQVAMR